MATQIQIRRDTAANWASVNPVLAQGELGIELDSGLVKLGDGATAWSALAYATRIPRAALSMSADGNRALTAVEASADILDITSSVSLTATRDVVLPLSNKAWIVYNGTSGAQSLRFIGASGTGVLVPPGVRTLIYSDGTNIRFGVDVDSMIGGAIYTPASLSLVTGTLNGGNVASVQTLGDGNVYDVQEVGGTPGFSIEFTFSGVGAFSKLQFHGHYTGTAGHTVQLQLWNWGGSAWDVITTIPETASLQLVEATVPNWAPYVNASFQAKIRVQHVSSGNASHSIQVDYLALNRPGVGQPTDHSALEGLGDDDHLQYTTRARAWDTLHNLGLAAAVAGNALTISLKQADGSTNPAATEAGTVRIAFPTAAGAQVLRSVTGTLSLTISAGSTLGFSASESGRIWIGAIDNAGTVELVAWRAWTGSGIWAPRDGSLVTTTAEGGAGGADSAGVLYSATVRSNVPFRVLGFIEIQTGGTAGNWSNAASVAQILAPSTPRPGELVQSARLVDGAVATGSTIIPLDDTIPQNTEGDQYMSLAITPRSALNLLQVRVVAFFTSNTNATSVIAALFRDAIADSRKAMAARTQGAAGIFVSPANIDHNEIANSTSSTTFALRAGPDASATVTFNGFSANRKLGGVFNSRMTIEEIQA